MNSQETAEAVRAAMLANDRATNTLGMTIAAIGPGTATASMTVREDMLNGFATCHGGLIATLADSAFAFACNSQNEMTVASGFDINLVAPARAGDRLTATAQEMQQAGRVGVYDVSVNNQHGELVALFRGRSYRIKGRAVLPGSPS